MCYRLLRGTKWKRQKILSPLALSLYQRRETTIFVSIDVYEQFDIRYIFVGLAG